MCIYSKKVSYPWAWGYPPMTEHLLSMFKDLGLIPSTEVEVGVRVGEGHSYYSKFFCSSVWTIQDKYLFLIQTRKLGKEKCKILWCENKPQNSPEVKVEGGKFQRMCVHFQQINFSAHLKIPTNAFGILDCGIYFTSRCNLVYLYIKVNIY